MTTALALHPLLSGSADYVAFVEALTAERLPTDDVGAGGRFFGLEGGPGAVAFGGLEGAGPDQMLSAASFYVELGWVPADRANAPEAVRRSRQFQGLCPSSAVLMCRTLR